ncbi:hypothetical protein AALC17_19845 [Oscillospiraceae bacterium 38-13]
MGDRFTRRFAAYATGFRSGTGGICPLVAERVPVGIPAYATGFSSGTSGVLPLVVMERAGTEQDAKQEEERDAAENRKNSIRHGEPSFSVFLWSITMILPRYGNVK